MNLWRLSRIIRSDIRSANSANTTTAFPTPWSRHRDSTMDHPAYFVEDIGSEPITHTCQACVLPLKLIPLYLYTSDTIEATFMYHFFYIFCNAYKIRVDDRDRTGSNSCLEGRRTTNYASSTWSKRRGTISQHPTWQAGTLPIELLLH